MTPPAAPSEPQACVLWLQTRLLCISVIPKQLLLKVGTCSASVASLWEFVHWKHSRQETSAAQEALESIYTGDS